MDNFAAARSQMGMSLGFHIVFAVIGVALPLMMTIAEWRFRATGDAAYLLLAKRWAKGTTILFAVGAVSGTVIIENGRSENGFLWTWLKPFPLVVGLLALSLFAYLAACYLAADAEGEDLKNDFRNRALSAGFISILAAFATYVAAGNYAVQIRDGLSKTPLASLILFAAAISALVAYHALWTRRFQRARLASAIQVATIIAGWGAAQYPFLVRPRITIFNSAAPDNIIVSLEIATVLGSLVLIPSLVLLLLIFKSNRRSQTSTDEAAVRSN